MKIIKLSGTSKSVLKPFMDYFCDNMAFKKEIENMNLELMTTLCWMRNRVNAKILTCGNFQLTGKKFDILSPLFKLFKNYGRKFPIMLLVTLPEILTIIWSGISLPEQKKVKPMKVEEYHYANNREKTSDNTLYRNKVESNDIYWKCQECQKNLAYFPHNFCVCCFFLFNKLI